MSSKERSFSGLAASGPIKRHVGPIFAELDENNCALEEEQHEG